MTDNQNDIVIGLLFGDEAKGATVDFLATQRETNANVRFSGGVQTAHNVVLPDGTHHTFRQFGSATFHKVRTILTKHMLVSPFDLAVEGNNLIEKAGWDVFQPLLVSENALVTTPIHRAVNRRREQLRGASAHGSCGLGIGETQSYANQYGDLAVRMKDISNPATLELKLRKLWDYAEQQVGDIEKMSPALDELLQSYANLVEDRLLNVVSDDVILAELTRGYNIWEGSQGVLLDESYGFHPHTTWATTTQQKAQELIAEAGMERGHAIGVVRTYLTRHGHGPFPSETLDHEYFEAFNKAGTFQGGWRAGLFDLPLFEYAVRANGGVDSLSVSHLDVPPTEVVVSYSDFPEIPTDFFNKDRNKQEAVTSKLVEIAGTGIIESTDEDDFLRRLEAVAGKPVRVKAYGPTWEDRK